VTDPAALRAEFPVLERLSYLNAGTNGPVPRAALAAAGTALREQVEGSRGDHAFFERLSTQMEELRGRISGLLGCESGELALTRSTTDGVNVVLSALGLGEGDEVLTSDEEHPGVLVPLAARRERHGLSVRVVPFASLAEEVGPETRLVACSHVSWMNGSVVDAAALAEAGAPVLLDGAQGLGAVPTDVRALGCDYYAASGQKWLCGPNGLGYLYVRSERIQELPAPWPGFGTVRDSARPLELELQGDAHRFDMGVFASDHTAWALAALDTLFGTNPAPAMERARVLAERLAALLEERGIRIAPRGASTLVSWEAAEPPAEVKRLRAEGIVVRDLPGGAYVRASVGAWSSEEELERLAALARSSTSS
jgi:selenocysteine lyase/cysteine desulfurase